MPRISTDSKSGLSAGKGEAMHEYKEPHERSSGWQDYELEDAGRHLERADKIKANPKFVEAIARHHEKKAAHHRKLAEGMKGHLKRGLVSEKALEKAAR
jgi:hypothetical protein